MKKTFFFLRLTHSSEETLDEWAGRQAGGKTTCVSAACFQNKAVTLGNADVTLSGMLERRQLGGAFFF